MSTSFSKDPAILQPVGHDLYEMQFQIFGRSCLHNQSSLRNAEWIKKIIPCDEFRSGRILFHFYLSNMQDDIYRCVTSARIIFNRDRMLPEMKDFDEPFVEQISRGSRLHQYLLSVPLTGYEVMQGSLLDLFLYLFPFPDKMVKFHWDRLVTSLGSKDLLTDQMRELMLKIFGDQHFVENIRTILGSPWFCGLVGRETMIKNSFLENVMKKNFQSYPSGAVCFGLAPKYDLERRCDDWYLYAFEIPTYLPVSQEWMYNDKVRSDFSFTTRKCELIREQLHVVGGTDTIYLRVFCNLLGYWQGRTPLKEIECLPQYHLV
ncbi:Hypothetical protein POVR1_LOCUS233 [uncultured virus]|nr:Hypothetical protein POVR1_LOCUS233 [uncultured virus]